MATASLPIIDISPYLSTEEAGSASSRAKTRAALWTACRNYGFFYLTGHGIPQSTTDGVIDAVRTFFTTSSPADKAAIRRQDPGQGIGDGARGYQVLAENVTQGKRDWHEGLDWYREIKAGEGVEAGDLVEKKSDSGDGSLVLTLKETSSSSPSSSSGKSSLAANHRKPPYALLEGLNPWPSSPEGFRSRMEQYIADLRIVGRAVMRALGEALELSDPDILAKSTDDSFWVMRAIGYPPLDPELEASGGVSCGAHTDYGCLTLLLTDNTKGALQVVRRRPIPMVGEELGKGEGEEEDAGWIEADPIPGAYVVNVGDMIELWTNGLIRSTLHRVVHKGQNYRVSVPFFLEPALNVVVEPLPECVAKTGGVKKAEPIRYGDHLAGKVGGNFYGGGGNA